MDRTASFYAQPSYARGGGLPIFSGSRRQRGGNVLGALKSFFMPLFGKVAKRGVGSAVNLAKNVALDAFSGKNIQQSLKSRGLKQAKQFGMDILNDTVNHINTPRTTAPRKAAAASRKRGRTIKARQRVKRAKTNF